MYSYIIRCYLVLFHMSTCTNKLFIFFFSSTQKRGSFRCPATGYTLIRSAISLLTANCLPAADTIIFPQKFWITFIVLPSSIWPSLRNFNISGAPNIHFMVQALPEACADKFCISQPPVCHLLTVIPRFLRFYASLCVLVNKIHF